MASGKANSCRVVTSLIYIVIGAEALVPSIKEAWNATLDLDLIGLLTASSCVLMVLAGVLGIMNVKRGVCRAMGIFIFAVSAFMFVWSIVKGYGYRRDGLIMSALAWLFIICI